MKYIKKDLRHFKKVLRTFWKYYSRYYAELKFWQYIITYAEARISLLSRRDRFME